LHYLRHGGFNSVVRANVYSVDFDIDFEVAGNLGGELLRVLGGKVP
jgi:hypothetical protein